MEFEVSIIIPVYNEMSTIANILNRINSFPFASKAEVMIVDDGSSDGTYKYINTVINSFLYKIFILRQCEHKGKGSDIRTAIKSATGKYIIICDASAEYNAENILLIYNELSLKGYDAVIGSRLKMNGKIFNGLCLILNRFSAFCINVLFGSKYTDVYTGCKGFKSSVIKSMEVESEGCEVEVEISTRLAHRKLSVEEVGVSYMNANSLNDKKIKFKDYLKGIWIVIKLRIVSIFKKI